MSKWYSTLIAKYRYDDAMAEKLKNDWMNYLYLLEQEDTTRFLSMEVSDEDGRESYEKEQLNEEQRYLMIEDGFAAAVGSEAIEMLKRVRQASHRSFDRSGRKPIAPPGFHYSPVSFRPYDEELKPDAPSSDRQ
jgi:hypothetical protein